MFKRNVLLSASLLILAVAMAPSFAVAAGRDDVASGKTQVVARAGSREITLSELRLEIARLGLSPSEPASERAALQSLLNRAILAHAAREAKLQRKPEAMARMYAAQDQALADYYLALASQPAEPTRNEIDDYIRKNPSLFAKRKVYDFIILSMDTENFREKALTPLFDKEPDFSRLASVLEKAGANYAIATVTQSGAAFPEPIRVQLAQYAARDNIVLKGDSQTQIMKIVGVRNDAQSPEAWPPIARRLLIEKSAAERAEAFLARLKAKTDIAYYRPSATPPAQAAPKAR